MLEMFDLAQVRRGYTRVEDIDFSATNIRWELVGFKRLWNLRQSQSASHKPQYSNVDNRNHLRCSKTAGGARLCSSRKRRKFLGTLQRTEEYDSLMKTIEGIYWEQYGFIYMSTCLQLTRVASRHPSKLLNSAYITTPLT